MDTSKSSAEIVEIAYVTDDEEAYWELIRTLHGRGTEIEFKIASDLTRSHDAIRRQIGADILGQLGWGNQAFREESISLLIGLLSDQVEDVIASAAFSLGHRKSLEAIEPLRKHLKHLNPRVRFGVAFGLIGLDDLSAIEGLIILSNDTDYDVRNWATFGLGSQCDIDTGELREALINRSEDPDPEIRGEALIGLARRKDAKVIDKVKKELDGEFFGGWAISAAELYPQKSYIPLLLSLSKKLGSEDSEYFMKDIKSALTACEEI